jgi:type I restriction enzyme S subunit
MADLSTSTHDGQSEQTAESLITQHIDIWTTAIEQKSSAGRGTSNKFSLYGIKKLRELILELAVRGKLVPQDPNDEPASVLLERIAAEKAQLVKEGKLKKQKPLPEISEDEKPFGLPNGWEFVQVGSVINRLSNGFSGTQNKDSNGYPLSRIESISDSVVNMNKIGFSPNIPIEKLDYYRLEKGDILLSHINSDFHVGKTAIYDGTNELYHGVNLLLLRVSRLVFNEYINLAIN